MKQTQGERQKGIKRGEEKKKRGDERSTGRGAGGGSGIAVGVRHSNTYALTGHNSRAAAKRSVSNEVSAQQQICWSRV